jgi:hypothetical protein
MKAMAIPRIAASKTAMNVYDFMFAATMNTSRRYPDVRSPCWWFCSVATFGRLAQMCGRWQVVTRHPVYTKKTVAKAIVASRLALSMDDFDLPHFSWFCGRRFAW